MVSTCAICVETLFLSQVSNLLVKMKSQIDQHCRALGVSLPPFNGRRFSHSQALPLEPRLSLLMRQLDNYHKKRKHRGDHEQSMRQSDRNYLREKCRSLKYRYRGYQVKLPPLELWELLKQGGVV